MVKIVLDDKEKAIIGELVKDPRASDNKISKLTNIPLKTVTRRRKYLEEKNLLYYFTYLDNFSGTNVFTSRQQYIITFKHGITREIFIKRFGENFDLLSSSSVIQKHVLESHLGEQNGCIVLVMIIESFSKDDLVEIFNAEIIKIINDAFGQNSVLRTEVIDLTIELNLLHNYSKYSMKNGKLTKISNKMFIS